MVSDDKVLVGSFCQSQRHYHAFADCGSAFACNLTGADIFEVLFPTGDESQKITQATSVLYVPFVKGAVVVWGTERSVYESVG